MTTIYLIRHAQAEGNLYRVCQGQYDGMLTENAKYQLSCLADRFLDVHIDAVYSSDLYRAAMTAKAVADKKGLKVKCHRGLREMHFGRYEGLSWGEINYIDPNFELKSNTKASDVSVPEGETPAVVGIRVYNAVLEIVRANEGKTVAIASHGVAVSSFVSYIKSRNMEDFSMNSYFGNTSVTKIIASADGNMEIEYENDMTHLASLPDKFVRAERPKPWHPDVKPIGRFGFDLRYRVAEFPSDLPKIREFGEDAWKSVYSSHSRFDAGHFIENAYGIHNASPDSVIFAVHGDKDVGLIMLDTRQKDEIGVGHIAFLYLTPPYRRMGLGAQLIGKAIFYYREKGLHTLRLNVSKTNISAIKLYERLGFYRSFSAKKRNFGQYVMKKDIGVKKFLSEE